MLFEISIFGEFRTKLPYLGIWPKISFFEIFCLKYNRMDLFESSLEKEFNSAHNDSYSYLYIPKCLCGNEDCIRSILDNCQAYQTETLAECFVTMSQFANVCLFI